MNKKSDVTRSRINRMVGFLFEVGSLSIGLIFFHAVFLKGEIRFWPAIIWNIGLHIYLRINKPNRGIHGK